VVQSLHNYCKLDSSVGGIDRQIGTIPYGMDSARTDKTRTAGRVEGGCFLFSLYCLTALDSFRIQSRN
jgi:hypothetical protein